MRLRTDPEGVAPHPQRRGVPVVLRSVPCGGPVGRYRQSEPLPRLAPSVGRVPVGHAHLRAAGVHIHAGGPEVGRPQDEIRAPVPAGHRPYGGRNAVTHRVPGDGLPHPRPLPPPPLTLQARVYVCMCMTVCVCVRACVCAAMCVALILCETACARASVCVCVCVCLFCVPGCLCQECFSGCCTGLSSA